MRLRAHWHRIRVAVFVTSVQCRHDGTFPLCLWCSMTALDPPLVTAIRYPAPAGTDGEAAAV
jgi:hypothetical protein